MADRPVLIDEQDGPCEICAAWAAKKHLQDEDGKTIGYRCDECGEAIPDVGQMPGDAMHGFSGIVAHHYHLRGIGPSGVPGRAVIVQELCPDCYRAHRLKVYPGADPEPYLDVTGKAVQAAHKRKAVASGPRPPQVDSPV